MTPPVPQDWNEEHQSEVPAVALLEQLGYRYVPAEPSKASETASGSRCWGSGSRRRS